MRNLFSLDSKLMRALTLLGDYIILNFLFFIACVPVFTIGAAKTALYRAMFDLMDDRGNMYKRFFRIFASEFKNATPLFLLQLAVQALLFWEFLIVYGNSIPLRVPMLFALLLLLLLSGALFSNIPVQLALFNATRKEYLKNAVYILLTELIPCLLAGLMDLFPIFLFLYNPGYFAILGPLWLLLYFSVTTNLSARMFRKPFARYVRLYEREQETADGQDEPENSPD